MMKNILMCLLLITGIAACQPTTLADSERACGSRIAFINGFDELYIINADGSNRTRLAEDFDLMSLIASVDWSPDGQQLLFSSVSLQTSSNSQLFTLNLTDNSIQQLTSEAHNHEFPIWSPDGRRIAYLDTEGNMVTNVWVINADGTEDRSITDGSENINLVGWSSDSSTLFFTALGTGLYSLNIDESENEPINLLGEGIWYVEGDLSMNSQKLLIFEAFGDDVLQIRDLEGNLLEEFTVNGARSARWSPDGSMIAYNNAFTDVFVVDVATGDSRNLTESLTGESDPLDHLPLYGWSPAGGLILFGIDGNLYSVRADGDSVTQITRDLDVRAVDWSPCLPSA